MPLPSPNLDDRDFQQLVDAARQRIVQSCPEWSDLSPSDPGVVLLETFAYLTDTLSYRMNRIPEKAYVEFLRLLGVQLSPPAAASTRLRFSASRAAERSHRDPARHPRDGIASREAAARRRSSQPPATPCSSPVPRTWTCSRTIAIW